MKFALQCLACFFGMAACLGFIGGLAALAVKLKVPVEAALIGATSFCFLAIIAVVLIGRATNP